MHSFLPSRLRHMAERAIVSLLVILARRLLSVRGQEQVATRLLDPMPLAWTLWYPDDIRRIAFTLFGEETPPLDDALCLQVLQAASFGDSLSEQGLTSIIFEHLGDTASIAAFLQLLEPPSMAMG